MKIAMVQLNPVVGDIAGNARKIIRWITKAKVQGANLAIFPELSLLGYPPRDLLDLHEIITQTEEWLRLVAKASRGIATVIGAIEQNPKSVGKTLFNTAVFCSDGVVKKVVRKTLLPTYDVFDETRHFESGSKRETLPFLGRTLGITICEDIWSDSSVWRRPPYTMDPVVELVGQGLQILINISASPYSMGKSTQRRDIIQHIASRHGVYVIYVNQVGGNDELIFDGGSMAYSREGLLLAAAQYFKEGITLVDLFRDSPEQEKFPDDLTLLEEALVYGLRDYVRKCGFRKVALGLSGGIDSSLVAYLAQRAVGPKNVLGLLMPSRFSSTGSILDARRVAKNLGIATRQVPIHNLHRAYEGSFMGMFGRRKADVTEENIQARIRGNLLMAVSNKLGHLVLTTGNKSELAVGYSTLYGDMSGGLAVISDLSKTLVYELCRFVNRRRKIFPESVLNKEPSAELRPGQKDIDSLPPYRILDPILQASIEDMKSEGEIVNMGYPKDTVKRVLQLVRRNEYKRRQSPPGLRVTSKAFGMGRRFPIACKI